jgi:CDP-glycerol glycerophosphotransferase
MMALQIAFLIGEHKMGNIIKITKKFILFLINLLVLIISLMIPKSDKIAIVGGWYGKRFADNSKHFYLYLNANLNKLGFEKVIWITRLKEIRDQLRHQGYKVYYVWSIFSIWYHLRAKYHLIDQAPIDINSFFSVRSIRINLWHGFPLKKIGCYIGDNKSTKKTEIQNLIDKWTVRGCWSDQFILATSEFSADILGKAFGVDEKKIIISGYPRNYESISDNSIKYVHKNEKNSYEEIKENIREGYKIIGYFPTFRDKRETLIFGTQNIEEINQFLDYCESIKIKLIGKFHFVGKNDKFGMVKSHKTFINLPSEADVYTFLDQLDILITDYSSIYFDFLHWNRPILFFPYDLEYYRDEDRGLIFDYEEFTPGPKVYSIGELQTFFLQSIEDIDHRYREEYSDKAELLKEKIFGDYKKMGIEHLIDKIRNIGLEEEKPLR